MSKIKLEEVDNQHEAESDYLRDIISRVHTQKSQYFSRYNYLVLKNNKEAAFTVFDHYDHQKLFVIYSIFVDPSHRRRGIARQVVREAEKKARQLGCSRISLQPKPLGDSIPLSDLKSFYLSEGYRAGKMNHLEKRIQ